MSQSDSRPCVVCGKPIARRRRQRYCTKTCRAEDLRAGPRRFAYADPPYPGNAKRLYGDHPDYAGEVDHVELIARLVDEFPDGWALSTGAQNLREVCWETEFSAGPRRVTNRGMAPNVRAARRAIRRALRRARRGKP